MDDTEWNASLAKNMLDMNTRKWKIRCEMMKEEGEMIEEEKLRERCDKKRPALQEGDLLRGDRYLLEDRYKPSKELRATTIREWERTLGLAIKAKEKID